MVWRKGGEGGKSQGEGKRVFCVRKEKKRKREKERERERETAKDIYILQHTNSNRETVFIGGLCCGIRIAASAAAAAGFFALKGKQTNTQHGCSRGWFL